MDLIIFVRRSPIGSKYPIVEALDYHDVGNHIEFFKFRVTEEQYALVENIGTDCLLLDVLKSDFIDSEFLNLDSSDETKDIRAYGLGISKYIEINPPIEDEV